MRSGRPLAVLLLAALLAGCAGTDRSDDDVATSGAIDPDGTAGGPIGAPVPDAPGTGSPAAGGTAVDGAIGSGDGAGPATAGAGASGAGAPTTVGPVQSGTLTAADHDDHLNPGRHRDYASRYLQSAGAGADAPSVDLTRRVGVVVTDLEGAPFAGARVSASTPAGTLAKLVTPSDGVAWLYPDVDALPAGFELVVTDRLGDVSERVAVRPDALPDAPDGTRRVAVRLPAVAAPATGLDVALVIDTTGSMGDELAYLQAELGSILGRVADAAPRLGVRVALVAYRDEGDAYTVRATDFTDDVERARATLSAERADGGGDYPEAMDRAMAAALALGWREDSVKVALLVADAPPHPDRMRATFEAALAARSRMIHTVPVAASGVAAEAQYLMRAMAAVTQAPYVFLTDDSGVGLPHEVPDIACYLVTRLDGLLVRVVRGLVEGVRVEPADEEILRRVGNYEAGRCLEGGA